ACCRTLRDVHLAPALLPLRWLRCLPRRLLPSRIPASRRRGGRAQAGRRRPLPREPSRTFSLAVLRVRISLGRWLTEVRFTTPRSAGSCDSLAAVFATA